MKPIKTDADHKTALAEIERLAILNPEAGTDDGDQLEVLATLVEAYEKERFPIEQPTPIEAIEFRMDQLGLSRKNLEDYIGSRSKVSEVLSGKRSLTLRMIRSLSRGLDIPADVLLQESLPPDPGLDWTRFPLQEMHRRGWIDSADEDRAEELVRGYLSDVREQELFGVLYRQTNYSERSGRRMDPYGIVAWSAQVVMKAKKQTDVEKYTPGIVTPEFMRNVAQCSWSDDGPLLAKEYLANHGICLVIEPHLPRTYLDGSVCIMSKKRTPVIGMTIRHDRIDNFWFVLLHELGHISKHLNGEDTLVFFDDLDASAQGQKEEEADKLAEEALIPRKTWKRFMGSEVTPGSIAELALQLNIHPAIVAGRWQHETGNFKRFSRMVGRKLVRRHYPEISWM